ncbi:hypothetical protein BDY19DRAFT_233434 [Irpex rosettiformis]|uniref:Uncharacterized protein n=1 Tax=Irpex rosettiformis TaxID=378272 RepID=A0ACB8TZN2_9APHY|nr:hypothetical protein BDY19DRAFT_233434 [Irpex rosettiformis]
MRCSLRVQHRMLWKFVIQGFEESRWAHATQKLSVILLRGRRECGRVTSERKAVCYKRQTRETGRQLGTGARNGPEARYGVRVETEGKDTTISKLEQRATPTLKRPQHLWYIRCRSFGSYGVNGIILVLKPEISLLPHPSSRIQNWPHGQTK